MNNFSMTQHWVLNEISQGEVPTILPQQLDFDLFKSEWAPLPRTNNHNNNFVNNVRSK